MTDRTRYILTYIPKDEVQKIHDAHEAEIMADDIGASVWDFCHPEDLEREREARTEADALEHAKILLPLDEFGEIHVFRQEVRKYRGARPSWETVARAVVYAGDTTIKFQSLPQVTFFPAPGVRLNSYSATVYGAGRAHPSAIFDQIIADMDFDAWRRLGFADRQFAEDDLDCETIELADDDITIIRRIDTRQVLGAIDRDLSDDEWRAVLAAVQH